MCNNDLSILRTYNHDFSSVIDSVINCIVKLISIQLKEQYGVVQLPRNTVIDSYGKLHVYVLANEPLSRRKRLSKW